MNLRRWKGLLLFITFVAVGLSILTRPSMGTMTAFNELGIDNNTVALFFIASAVLNIFLAWANMKWNALGQAIFHGYMVASWIAVVKYPSAIPATAALFYSLLSGMLILDLISDARGLTHNGGR